MKDTLKQGVIYLKERVQATLLKGQKIKEKLSFGETEPVTNYVLNALRLEACYVIP